jgi:ubiquinone/menaquinone biosynthesis C-methylase UbiE
MPFRAATFDVVTSVAAFEHFLAVPTVMDEVQRVLRPGGVFWACVHLFTSLSGAHNIGYQDVPAKRLPKGAEPWDHLRRQRLPFTVPLNRWRRADYADAMAQRFRNVQSYCAIQEGADWLTDDVVSELAGYDHDELTCAAFVVVGQR